MASEDYMMETAREAFERGRAEANRVDAWHGIMTAVEGVHASDLRVAAEVLRHIGRALQAERDGEPFDHYQLALNDAAAVVRDTHRDQRPLRITRIRELADAVEAKELAQ